MDLKQMLLGSLMRRMVLIAFMLVLAMIAVSLMQMTREFRAIQPITLSIDECPLNLNSTPDFNVSGPLNNPTKESEKTLPQTVFKELMEKNLLPSNARALCVGEGSGLDLLALRELGYFDAFGVEIHPSLSLFKRRFVYELDFEDNHFDFVFSRDLDRVSVPSLLVQEMERVLRFGGTGALLMGGARNFYSGGSVRSLTIVVSFLKSSDVVHICGVGPITLVIFKKNFENFASFEHFQLPGNCPSVTRNKPFMKYIEPISSNKPPKLSYVPNFMNISSRNKLIYINVGAGEFAKKSVAKLSKPYCSNHHSSFDVFVIDHKISVLSSYVTDPDFTFVYDPSLSVDHTAPDISSDEFLSAPVDEEGFDFIRWFNGTVGEDGFVVLEMNAKLVELNILVELFKTGAICRVDEVFLRCSNGGKCVALLDSLRKSGVYVHQWLGD